MSRGKRVVMALLLFVVVIGIAEGLASAVVLAGNARSVPAAGNFRQAVYDSLLGWVGVPNMAQANNYGPNLTLTTNADGMRVHRPVEVALQPGQTRAICSGDSFTFGSGVADSETFCAYLEQEIPGLQTLNMSQRGFGIDQMYLWYKRDGVRYPHQVHLFAFIWNDFERMALTSMTGYPKPRLRLRDDTLVVENVPVPAWTEPGVVSRVFAQLPNTRLMELLQQFTDVSEATRVQRTDDQVFAIAEQVFREVRKLNVERGSKPVLVYLPAIPDLTPGPLDKRRARLAEFARSEGLTLIDLTSAYRAVPQDSLDWMFITPNALPVNGASGHYTAMGNQWVAKQLATHLRPFVAPAATVPNSIRVP